MLRIPVFDLVRARWTLLLIVLLVSAWLPLAASAAEAQARRFASVLKLQGTVQAISAGKPRTLNVGDAVFVGERVRAGAASEAVLKTEDAGYIAIRPNAEFVAEAYAAEGKPTDHATVRVIGGAIRMITGWIGRTNPREVKVNVSTVTIGIRGTDHEPYAMTAELARAMVQPEGVYDKVNRGATLVESAGNSLDVPSGRVGFVRQGRSRALLTILLPVLLEKVPAFYVPGQFDDELDSLSSTADDEAMRELAAVQEASGKDTAAQSPTLTRPAVADTPPAQKSAVVPSVKPAPDACNSVNIARAWLNQLDNAIVKRDASTITALFARDVKVDANVRGTDGSTTSVSLSREELVSSTIAAMQGLSGFQQRRLTVEARAVDVGNCNRIHVRSNVIEQGRRNGAPYRFESVEEYVLERRGGVWLAVQAETTQR